MKKNGQKGAWPRSRDLLFKFWDSSNISGTTEDTNLKFCTWIEGKGPDTKQKNAKLVKRGRGLDYVQHPSPVTF